MNLKKIKDISNYELNKLDWAVFGLIAALSYVVFVHGDLLSTAGSSISYLAGHIKDAYAYNRLNNVEPAPIYNNYMPSTYILFAIWNIPLYLLGIVNAPMTDSTNTTPFVAIMWYKALPVLFFFACAYLIFKIAKLIGFSKNKAKIIVFLFLTTPLAFYSSLIFSQYDSFTLFFVLLGTYYYFKNNMLKFSVFFGIAMTFKYFALLIYVPLLFLKEKKILKIIKNCLIFSVPILIEILCYINSPDFKLGVLGFQATNYLTKCFLDTGYAKLSIFVIAWVFVVVWAYLKNVNGEEKEEFFKWAIYFCNIVVCLTFGVSLWHPQWLLFMVPFTLFSTVINKNSRVFYIIDIFLFLLMTLINITFYECNVDERLLRAGIFKKIVNYNSELTVGLKEIFFFLKNKGIYVGFFALFSALLLLGVVFKHPKHTITNFNENFKQYNVLFRLRFLAVFFIWVIPNILCVLMSLASGNKYYIRNTNVFCFANYFEKLKGDSVIEQHFKASKEMTNLNELRVTFLKNSAGVQAVNNGLEILIEDEKSKEILFKEKFNVSGFKNDFPTKFKLGDIKINPGNEYKIKFSLKEGNSNLTNIMFRTTKKEQDAKRIETKTEIVGNPNEQFYCVDGSFFKENNLAYDLIGKKNY